LGLDRQERGGGAANAKQVWKKINRQGRKEGGRRRLIIVDDCIQSLRLLSRPWDPLSSTVDWFSQWRTCTFFFLFYCRFV
jgi:hypothetical protein